MRVVGLGKRTLSVIVVHLPCFGQGVGTKGQQLGAAEFGALLHAAGAEPRYASGAWVQNHFRWIAWKLASYERQHPACLAGRMLSAPVVLDQLLYRWRPACSAVLFCCRMHWADRRALGPDACKNTHAAERMHNLETLHLRLPLMCTLAQLL